MFSCSFQVVVTIDTPVGNIFSTSKFEAGTDIAYLELMLGEYQVIEYEAKGIEVKIEF